MNIEVYRDQINATQGTNSKVPIAYFSTLMAVAGGTSAQEVVFDCHAIPANMLELLAER